MWGWGRHQHERDVGAMSAPTPDRERTLCLLVSQTCGYCHRVLRAVDAMGREVPTRDARRDAEAHQMLVEATGRTQVPCLFVDGTPLLESLDIIAWLEAYQEFLEGNEAV